MEYFESTKDKIKAILDDNPKIYYNRAASYLNQGLWFKALSECKKAQFLYGNNQMSYLYELIKVLYAMGKYKESKMLINENIQELSNALSEEKYNEVQRINQRCSILRNLVSVRVINNIVEFKYLGCSNVTKVEVMGDFTEWENKPICLIRGPWNIWHVSIEKLAYGLHYYKFLINEEEVLDVFNHFIFKTNGRYANLFIVGKPNRFNGDKLFMNEGNARRVYIGETIAGIANGFGLQQTSIKGQDGKAYYFGDFKDNMEHGYGMLMATGNGMNMNAIGNYKKGLFTDGLITLTNEQDEYIVSCGKFDNYLLNGAGQKLESDGITWSFLEGNFVDDIIQGSGRLEAFIEEDIYYEGQLSINQNMNGYGICKLPTGDKYEGSYKDGLFNGIGKYYWQNGQVFAGNFQQGKRNGYGELYIPAIGAKYKGQFNNDKMHGKGTWWYDNGAVFEGEFSEGMFIGIGIITTAAAEKFIKEFKRQRAGSDDIYLDFEKPSN